MSRQQREEESRNGLPPKDKISAPCWQNRLSRRSFLGLATATGLSFTRIGQLFAEGTVGWPPPKTLASPSVSLHNLGRDEIAVYAFFSDPGEFWDPAETFSTEIIVMANLYESLLRYDPDKQGVVLSLATSYQASDDGLTWTFGIREGVSFHCGEPLNAAAVKYSFDRTIGLGKGASYIFSCVDHTEVVDDYTVKFNLKHPAPFDLMQAAGYAAWVYCPKCTEEKGHDWYVEGNACGTGPYKLQEWKRGSQVVLTQNEAYRGGWKDNQFKIAVFNIVPESATRRQMLEAGEADITQNLPVEDLEAMKSNPDTNIITAPSWQTLVAHLNTQRGPLKEVKVRQALSYAVPYDALIRDVMGGYATKSTGPLPKGLWGYTDQLPQYTYDLQRAKSLLAEAGYPGGGFKLDLVYTAGEEIERKFAELYKTELAKIGIELDIRGIPWDAQTDAARSSDVDRRQDIFVMYWWPDYPDPYSFLFGMYHSEETPMFNLCYFNNKEFDALIDEAYSLSGTNRQKALELYLKAQTLLVEQAPALWIMDQDYSAVTYKTFQGFKPNPAYSNVVFFYNCWRNKQA